MSATPEFWAAAFSSETDKWNTPPRVVRELATVFNWDVDVCASGPNVCANYYAEADNGLAQTWRGLCWMNPPYGDEIGVWVEKARTEPGTVVCLLPARTDTKWWQENTPYADLVVFIRGRLKFGGQENSAPFPSAFVVFGQLSDVQQKTLSYWGWAVRPSNNANCADPQRLRLAQGTLFT